MARLNLTLSAAVVFISTAVVCVTDARAQETIGLGARPVLQTASASLVGGISGIVTDEHGAALPGAMVSVLGATMAMDVTDARGRFDLGRLPAGDYVLRAHLEGFSASRREIVRIVGAAVPAVYRIQLHRLDAAVATGGTDALASRPILAAGFALPHVEDPPGGNEKEARNSDADHSHGETAWRLRHLPRSILKDSSNAVVIAESDAPETESLFAGAAAAGSGLVSSLFGDLPFSGEVNLLTTGAYAPGSFLSGDRLPRSVAYLSIGAPVSTGRWSVRAAMSEGDLSSWIVAGSFLSERGATHSYDFGFSYSAQEYQRSNLLGPFETHDGSRNVGEIYGVDRWAVVPGVTFEYGGRFARYDYLRARDFLSPRAGLTLEPTKATRVTASFAQHMVAPGAEEFLSPGMLGPWLPPERTFAPLEGNDLRIERARTLDFGLEHDLGGASVVGIRRFFDAVDDQLVTLFGLDGSAAPRSVGHYIVANGGNVDAEGWAVRLSSQLNKRLRGTVDYTLTRARWSDRDKAGTLASWVPAALRPETERVQDVTTTLQTDIPETATRVFLLYKVNTGFTRSDFSLDRPGLDARFDLQVNQALPFGLAGTQWELLLGLRNLFRDPSDRASIYDELLVVRPPKRVVGGFLVKF